MWQLFQFPLCPFSRKVRLVLAEKGVGHELVRENPWELVSWDEGRDPHPGEGIGLDVVHGPKRGGRYEEDVLGHPGDHEPPDERTRGRVGARAKEHDHEQAG